MSGDINVSNDGHMEAVNIGGVGNTAVNRSISGTDPLTGEIETVLAAIGDLPLAEGDQSVNELKTAGQLVTSGRVDEARAVLKGVGTWVANLASSLGANLLASAIRGQ